MEKYLNKNIVFSDPNRFYAGQIELAVRMLFGETVEYSDVLENDIQVQHSTFST